MSIIKQIFISMGIALLSIGIIKFNVISEAVYTPRDVSNSWEYIDNLISLAGINDGTCSAKAIEARNKIAMTNMMLDTIIQDHKNEHRYVAIAAVKAKMDMRPISLVLC
jgi:hypothetical protein